jgi:hypothetical protein
MVILQLVVNYFSYYVWYSLADDQSFDSFVGGIRFFSCTGLLIKYGANTETGGRRRTVILTSASLVRTCDKPDTIDGNLRVGALDQFSR